MQSFKSGVAIWNAFEFPVLNRSYSNKYTEIKTKVRSSFFSNWVIFQKLSKTSAEKVFKDEKSCDSISEQNSLEFEKNTRKETSNIIVYALNIG